MRDRIAILGLVLLAACAAYLSIGARGDWGFVLAFRGQKLAGLLLVALAMSWATLVFQTITANRILTPSIMGFDALYLLLLSALVWGLGAQTYRAMPAQGLMAANVFLLCGAALALFGALLRSGRDDLMRLILTGVVLSVLFRSVTAYLQRVIDPNEYAVIQAASFARFSAIEVDVLGLSVVLTLLACGALWHIRHRLDVLALGPLLSTSLGEAPARGQWHVLILVSVLVSVSTALVGPVTFFGLLVTSLTYQVMNAPRHALLLPTAALIGGIILVGGQTVMERLLGLATPLSVVVEFLGGLVFLALLLRRQR
ncbi:iron chelate uptake ABC transporter family permease subunit [uncultured Roseobacter sp.]|uniref:iron chelate uptake ABC transporter family permease subunit n=1 Tax=uncultured Roseobacter sp. TaxID=114847 RepID=UPI0026325022|nr:iron chelate uptake ABC transporter family permease subunit [uncultured Roseobacter sp.]